MVISRGRAKKLEVKPSPGSLSPKISRGLTWDRAHDSEVRNQQVVLEIYRTVANLHLLRSSLADHSGLAA
jgi:hypothetical protein